MTDTQFRAAIVILCCAILLLGATTAGVMIREEKMDNVCLVD